MIMKLGNVIEIHCDEFTTRFLIHGFILLFICDEYTTSKFHVTDDLRLREGSLPYVLLKLLPDALIFEQKEKKFLSC